LKIFTGKNTSIFAGDGGGGRIREKRGLPREAKKRSRG